MAPDDQINDAIAAVKPKLRGWLHVGIFPVAVIAGAVFIAVAPTSSARISGGLGSDRSRDLLSDWHRFWQLPGLQGG